MIKTTIEYYRNFFPTPANTDTYSTYQDHYAKILAMIYGQSEEWTQANQPLVDEIAIAARELQLRYEAILLAENATTQDSDSTMHVDKTTQSVKLSPTAFVPSFQ